MKTIIRLLFIFIKNIHITICGIVFSVSVIAAAPVEDIRKPQTTTDNSITLEAGPQALKNDAHYQGQLLKEEVRALRGIVDELRNDVKQLTKQQKSNYLNLDQRLSAQSRNIKKSPNIKHEQPSTVQLGFIADKNKKPAALPEKEVDHYNKAYFYLKSGDINKAIIKFKAHIDVYPSGGYVANAYYWLGEIYLLQSQLDLALEAFMMIQQNHPTHRKYLDSKFKMGQVYHMLGNQVKARDLLASVAEGESNVAILARKFIDENF